MPVSVLGLDIGGANLKIAHSSGTAALEPFELWKHPNALLDVLRTQMDLQPPFELLAVTMTGEICDCFTTKREGVAAILDSVTRLAAHHPVLVWQTDGQLVDVATAKSRPIRTAAANWSALAHYAGRYVPKGSGLLIDIGSTTTDIVPLAEGKPATAAQSDLERLRCHEMIYTGVRRTPVCALLGAEGAAEWFATTLDVYLLLGLIAEDANDRRTADGRPATRVAAQARLARMLCADSEELSEAATNALAVQVSKRQIELIRRATTMVASTLQSPLCGIVLAGSGEFLARATLEADRSLKLPPVISLAEQLGSELSNVACAYAIAVLAAEKSYGSI
jgi:probable H4MPT-linked C1 transfer pathway protein